MSGPPGVLRPRDHDRTILWIAWREQSPLAQPIQISQLETGEACSLEARTTRIPPAGNVAQGSRDWPGRGKTMRSPDTPSEEERARHNLTHAPAKPWCAECVAARGRDACHQAVTSKQGALITVFELDEGESGRAADLHNNVNMLVAGVTSTGVVHAVGAQIKVFRRQERG